MMNGDAVTALLDANTTAPWRQPRSVRSTYRRPRMVGLSAWTERDGWRGATIACGDRKIAAKDRSMQVVEYLVATVAAIAALVLAFFR